MKHLFLSIILITTSCLFAQTDLLSKKINILKSYDQDHLHRIALLLGGIGTGTVSLGKESRLTIIQ